MNLKLLVISIVSCIIIAMLSRFFMAGSNPGWGITIAAAVLSFVAFPVVSVFLLKGRKRRYQLSRYILLGLVAGAGFLYYNTWNNNVCVVSEAKKVHDETTWHKKNLIIGKELMDTTDPVVNKMNGEKKWNSVFEMYNSYNPSDIWTKDSIAVAKRKLNGSLLALVLLISILFMHTVESLLFRKKANTGAYEQVFISYNHENKAEAFQLAALLRQANVETVIDENNNLAGDKISEFIAKSLFDSAITLLLVSKQSLLSGWVSIEAMDSFRLSELDRRRKCIPCSLDESFRDKGFGTETIRLIDERITALDEDTRLRQNPGTDVSDNNIKRKRLVKLRNHLSEILEHLDQITCVDISGNKLQQNFTKILEAIEKKFEENRETGG